MSEDIVAGVASVYLRRGRFIGLTAYGIYATRYRLIVAKVRTPFISLLYFDGVLSIGLVAAEFLVRLADPSSGPVSLLGVLASLAGFLFLLLPSKLVEKKVQGRVPKSFWDIEPRDKELELTTGETSLIELKLPKAFSSGHVRIVVREGREFKLRVYRTGMSSLALALRVHEVIQAFAVRAPSQRTLDLTTWSF